MYLTATNIKHSGISSTFAYQISFFFSVMVLSFIRRVCLESVTHVFIGKNNAKAYHPSKGCSYL